MAPLRRSRGAAKLDKYYNGKALVASKLAFSAAACAQQPIKFFFRRMSRLPWRWSPWKGGSGLSHGDQGHTIMNKKTTFLVAPNSDCSDCRQWELVRSSYCRQCVAVRHSPCNNWDPLHPRAKTNFRWPQRAGNRVLAGCQSNAKPKIPKKMLVNMMLYL